MMCPACSANGPADSRFCRQCGISLPVSDEPRMCPTCKVDVPPGSRYCYQCGADLSSESPPAPTDLPAVASAPEAMIAYTNTDLWDSPRQTTRLARLAKGSYVTLSDEPRVAGMAAVQTADGTLGWVHLMSLDMPLPSTKPRQGSAPSPQRPKAGWVQVRTEAGQVAWVYAREVKYGVFAPPETVSRAAIAVGQDGDGQGERGGSGHWLGSVLEALVSGDGDVTDSSE
jgi:hypothetical protein